MSSQNKVNRLGTKRTHWLRRQPVGTFLHYVYSLIVRTEKGVSSFYGYTKNPNQSRKKHFEKIKEGSHPNKEVLEAYDSSSDSKLDFMILSKFISEEKAIDFHKCVIDVSGKESNVYIATSAERFSLLDVESVFTDDEDEEEVSSDAYLDLIKDKRICVGAMSFYNYKTVAKFFNISYQQVIKYIVTDDPRYKDWCFEEEVANDITSTLLNSITKRVDE